MLTAAQMRGNAMAAWFGVPTREGMELALISNALQLFPMCPFLGSLLFLSREEEAAQHEHSLWPCLPSSGTVDGVYHLW